MKKGRRTARIILVLLLVAGMAGYLKVSFVRTRVTQVMILFTSNSVENVIGYLRSFGKEAPIAAFILMIVQAVLAPFSETLVIFANSRVFGWELGMFFSWIGKMLGSYLCFLIGRIVGRDIIEWMLPKIGMRMADDFLKKYGTYILLFSRFFPFFSFDAVSYVAGMTSVNRFSFLTATGIGQLPSILIYSYAGKRLPRK